MKKQRRAYVHPIAFVPIALLLGSAAQGSSERAQAQPFEPALRELWTGGSERFLRQWMIAGPIGANLQTSIDPSALKPTIGQPLMEQNPRVRWTAHTSWTDVIDLNAVGGRAPTIADSVDNYVYVAGSLQRDSAGIAELSIGSERAYSVWLNGKPIHSRSSVEGFAPDRDRIPVTLQKGENSVLLRVHETSIGSSQFSLRAVSANAALSKVQEIAPVLVASSDDEVAVRTHFAMDPASAPVNVQVISAGGTVVAQSTAARGEIVRFASKDWHDGAYEIRVSTNDGWKNTRTRYLPWYKGDAISAVRKLIEAAARAGQGVHGDTVRMLADMAKDRLGGSIENASRASWRLVHSPLMEYEELEHDASGRTGSVRAEGFVRLAYADEIDGSTQFCRAYLPSEYNPTKAWPLVTFLHGFNPANPEYIDWWGVDERHNPVPAEKGAIIVEPHGRGNAQYSGMGERDVLRCIAEARRRFSVDADRIYLTGESMGGHGTWAVASRHPDLFAAAAPVYGGWDFRITSVNGPSNAPAPKTDLDAYSLERASSFASAENLLHVPLLVVHGDVDAAVNVENSRHAVRLLQRWGYNIRYHEMPGWAHEDLGQRSNIVDWLLTHERVTAPHSVRLRSTDMAAASAYWVRVDAFEKPSHVVRLSAHVLEPGLIRVDSTNVAALTLDLPDSLRGSRDKLKIIWNGDTHEMKSKEGAVTLGATPHPATALKRPGLEGPLPAVLATPFAIVAGTISPDTRMRESIQARAESLVGQWARWQKNPPRLLKDTEVSSDVEKRYSLILVGGADANAVTRRFAKQLPFSTSKEGIVVDGRQWKVTDSVLQAIYPSPAAPDRYVYVAAATSPDGMYFWKPQLVHFIQGYPLTMFDWVIQDGRRPPPGTMNPVDAYVAAGVFDATWRRQDQWTVLRDEQAASKWTLRHAPSNDFVASPSALQTIAGRYELFPGLVLTVRVDGNGLIVDVPGEPSIPLAAESDSVFINPATGDAAEFLRDERGNISGASVDNNGGIFLAKRLR